MAQPVALRSVDSGRACAILASIMFRASTQAPELSMKAQHATTHVMATQKEGCHGCALSDFFVSTGTTQLRYLIILQDKP